jgi:hypothetical protein
VTGRRVRPNRNANFRILIDLAMSMVELERNASYGTAHSGIFLALGVWRGGSGIGIGIGRCISQ